jgi:antitoxin VapB
MIILSQRTEQLARQLAERNGKTPAEVIHEALERSTQARGARVPSECRRNPSFERMMEISDRFAHHPVLDKRTADEIIGYDEHGLPQ